MPRPGAEKESDTLKAGMPGVWSDWPKGQKVKTLSVQLRVLDFLPGAIRIWTSLGFKVVVR